MFLTFSALARWLLSFRLTSSPEAKVFIVWQQSEGCPEWQRPLVFKLGNTMTGLARSCSRRQWHLNRMCSVHTEQIIRNMLKSSLKFTTALFKGGQWAAVGQQTVVWPPQLYCTLTHIHKLISHLNIWITALNENPWLYFVPSVKADLFLHVPEPRGLLPSLSAPNVWHLHNGLSAVLCGQSREDFRPTFPADPQ